eukprot:7316292-Prymnesium_polylepis.1
MGPSTWAGLSGCDARRTQSSTEAREPSLTRLVLRGGGAPSLADCGPDARALADGGPLAESLRLGASAGGAK